MRWLLLPGLPVFSVLTSATVLVLMMLFLHATVAASQPVLVVNPYAGIDWDAIEHHKGNLHTHTTESDGSYPPAQVIDLYHEHGYTVLALTDHDRCTWPWEAFDLSSKQLAMTAIPGNELSRHHHTLSLFCEYETDETDLDAALEGVAKAGGLAILCHPAMHWEPKYSDASRLRRFLDAQSRPDEIPADVLAKYIALFRRHEHLVATEISNASEPMYRYPLDRLLWDRLLSALMPERPVWGVNTDDMHSMDHFGVEYVVFLTDQRDTESLHTALSQGAYYFSSRRLAASGPDLNAEPPRIHAITYDAVGHHIEVTAVVNGVALPDHAYTWISDGETIHVGPRLAYHAVPMAAPYARLEITADTGMTFTNPFGFGE